MRAVPARAAYAAVMSDAFGRASGFVQVAHRLPILVADIACLCGVDRYVGFAAVSLTSQAITVTTRPAKVPSIRTRTPADRIAVRRAKA